VIEVQGYAFIAFPHQSVRERSAGEMLGGSWAPWRRRRRAVLPARAPSGAPRAASPAGWGGV